MVTDKSFVYNDVMNILLEDTIDQALKPGWSPFRIYGVYVDDVRVGALVYRLGDDDVHRYDGHIGYTIDEEFRGHRYATKACRLLVKQLQDEGVDHVLITCDPDNIPSKKTIEALGATFMAREDIPECLRGDYAADETEKLIYRWELRNA